MRAHKPTNPWEWIVFTDQFHGLTVPSLPYKRNITRHIDTCRTGKLTRGRNQLLMWLQHLYLLSICAHPETALSGLALSAVSLQHSAEKYKQQPLNLIAESSRLTAPP
jgi:hypothetical protein